MSRVGWFMIGYGAAVVTLAAALVFLELLARLGEAMSR